MNTLRNKRFCSGLAGARSRDLRIKSPQLYQLSYQPKHLKLLGKARARSGSFGAVVPVVYPTGTSMSSMPRFSEEDMGDLWRRTVSG